MVSVCVVTDVGLGETDGESLSLLWLCDGIAEADSMLGLFVVIGTPGREHGCIPRGLCVGCENGVQSVSGR